MKESLKLPSHPPYVHTVKIKLTALFVCVCVLIAGACFYLPGVVSVSSSVNGRDLPIYCVKTDKPQIALTFDAAWGNDIGNHSENHKNMSQLGTEEMKSELCERKCPRQNAEGC